MTEESKTHDRYVIIPVEVKVREFASRLLVAYWLMKSGYRVIIGDHYAIKRNIGFLPKSVYLARKLAVGKTGYIKKIRKCGNKLVSIDEEGIGRLQKLYLNNRFSHENISRADYVFTWGSKDYESLSTYYHQQKDKFKITGNPRVDIWKNGFDSDAQKIQELKSAYGDFVFIPSNFGGYSDERDDDDDILLARQAGILDDPELKRLYFSRLVYVRKGFQEYVKMIGVLSEKYPDKTIIIRPHPMDKQEKWHNHFRDSKNVKTVYEGTLGPYIDACGLMIHFGCHAGIEAYFKKKPSIAFLPVRNAYFENHPAFYVSQICDTYSHLFELIENALDNKPAAAAIDVKAYFFNTDAPSYDNMIKYIDLIGFHAPSGPKYNLIMLNDLYDQIKNHPAVKNTVKKIKQRVLSKSRIERSPRTYSTFPYLYPEEIREYVKRFDGFYNMRTEMNITRVSKAVYEISET